MWWYLGSEPQVRERDPRVDDPDYYKDRHGRWVKRTEWTVENYPSTSDWDTYCRFVEETSPRERGALLSEYMASKGLVRWHECWVTPKRAEELEAGYQEGVARARHEARRASSMGVRPWMWC